MIIGRRAFIQGLAALTVDFMRQRTPPFLDELIATLNASNNRPAATNIDRIIFNNPSVDNGTGLWITHTPQPFTESVPTSNTLSLIHLDLENTAASGAGIMYGIVVETKATNIDKAAGIAVINKGKADGIYMKISGISGNPADNDPTGIGIDLNQANDGTQNEASSSNGGHQGIQIYDWSTTDQGVGGPRSIFLSKTGNMDTDHQVLNIRSNRHSIDLITNSNSSGYSSGTGPVIRIADEYTGNDLMTIQARGVQIFQQDGLGIFWTGFGGGVSAEMTRASSTLRIRIPTGGFNFQDNTATYNYLSINDSSGDITILNNLNVNGDNVTIGIADSVAAQLQITGAASGTEGGQILLHMSADHDTTYDHWRIDVYEDDLRLGRAGLTAVTLAAGMVVGSPTGGDKGAGTINAQAVYDDDTLLTDHVFEPDYLYLPLAALADFFTDKKHLPTIPGRKEWDKGGRFSLGRLVTSLWETVEVQAIYITQLHDRIMRLEETVK